MRRVGRKTRRAQAVILEFRCYAPVLSRDAQRDLVEDRRRINHGTAQNRRESIEVRNKTASAPIFSPYPAPFRRIAPLPIRLCIDTGPSLNTLERLHEDGCILG
jgi:hypothetical protein